MTQTNRPDFFKTCPVCNAETPPAILNCPNCGVNLEFARAKSIENTQPTKNTISHFQEDSNIPKKKKTPLWLSIIGVIVGCCILLVVYGIIKDLFIMPLMNANAYPTQTATYRAAPDLSGCLHWSQVTAQMKGKFVCVYGKVYYHFSNYELKKTFLYFGNTNQPYITSSDGWSQSLDDVCIQTEGIVQIDSSQTPHINISGDELYSCLSWME